jgi:hypothetical protein
MWGEAFQFFKIEIHKGDIAWDNNARHPNEKLLGLYEGGLGATRKPRLL